MVILKPKTGKILDKTIVFLVQKYTNSGRNGKPVILHSLNVAFYLLEQGYDLETAQVGILHDLIEDSSTKIEEISASFGKKIATLVEALSFKREIKNKKERYQELFARIKIAGKRALLVKCADIYINSFYIHLVEDKKEKTRLIEKLKYFLDISQPMIGKEVVWRDLKKRAVFFQNKKFRSNNIRPE